MNCYCLIVSILDFRLNLKFADMKDKEKREKGKLHFCGEHQLDGHQLLKMQQTEEKHLGVKIGWN